MFQNLPWDSMRFHGIPWGSMRFYDVPVNQCVPTEANRGLTSYRSNHESRGLIAIGVFLMQWSATHCLQHFEERATSIFKLKNDGAKLSWSQSLQQLL
jgi:hypothetical protein